jgi:hypothetical protein
LSGLSGDCGRGEVEQNNTVYFVVLWGLSKNEQQIKNATQKPIKNIQ